MTFVQHGMKEDTFPESGLALSFVKVWGKESWVKSDSLGCLNSTKENILYFK